jgi:hypothetical protein
MIDPDSKAYLVWKSFFGLAELRQDEYGYQLAYTNRLGQKVEVEDLAIKDFGEAQYLAWTESLGEGKRLIILELHPHRERIFDWEIAPSNGKPMFWALKWSPTGLHGVYNDQRTNFALRVTFGKRPSSLQLNVMELGPLICIQQNWRIIFKDYQEKDAKLFDLGQFKLLEDPAPKFPEPTEMGENDEELEDRQE